MKIKELISRFADSYRESVRRFSLTFAASVALALLICYMIIVEDYDDIVGYFTMAVALGMLVSLYVSLLRERYGFSPLISLAASVISILVCTVLLDRYDDNTFMIMAYFGVCACVVCLIVFEVYRTAGSESTFGYLLSQAFYTGLLTTVVEVGVCICIAAFDNLIYGIDDVWKVYEVLSVLIYTVIGVNHFLASIPQQGEEVSMPNAYSLIINKASLVIYLLLLVILYIYLFKSIITLNLPKGRINIFASIALLMFCGYYLSVRGEQQDAHKSYLRIGGWLMLPIVLIQAVAIYIRVSELGLTAWRCLSLACNLVAILFIIDAILMKKVKWLFAAMAVICLLVSVGPLNCVSVANRWQQGIIEKVLKDNGMLTADNVIIPNSNVPAEQQKRLLSAYDYLDDQARETLSDRQQYLISAPPGTLYGFDVDPGYRPDVTAVYFSTKLEIYPVTGFVAFRPVSYFSGYYERSDLTVMIEEYDLTEQIRQFALSFDEENPPETLRFEVEGGVLEVSRLNVEYDSDQHINYVSLDGYLLYR
ncbi:MAG: DUF4153 domain-containing protein [Erysipelotrichaceae bacterium]|nr:DUF4153 domain-containing protein [Erysipelotrichaceae bacterium]